MRMKEFSKGKYYQRGCDPDTGPTRSAVLIYLKTIK
jgi:hypothetical protein